MLRGEADDLPRPERVLLGTCGLGANADTHEAWFATTGCPKLEDVLRTHMTAWRTDPTPNGFPRLPVRNERALAWLAVFSDADARDSAAVRLAAADIGQELDRRTSWRRTLRLVPTVRSAHPAAEPARARAAAQSAANATAK